MHNCDPFRCPGERDVKRANALAFLTNDPSRLDDNRSVNLEALDESSGLERDLLYKQIKESIENMDEDL